MKSPLDQIQSGTGRGRGGRRPGAGRKPGGKNKKSREIADKAAAEGITPIELMLRTMRELWREATKGDKFDHEKAVAACEIAKDAAPYIHPRLSSIEASVGLTNHEDALDELEGAASSALLPIVYGHAD